MMKPNKERRFVRFGRKLYALYMKKFNLEIFFVIVGNLRKLKQLRSFINFRYNQNFFHPLLITQRMIGFSTNFRREIFHKLLIRKIFNFNYTFEIYD